MIKKKNRLFWSLVIKKLFIVLAQMADSFSRWCWANANVHPQKSIVISSETDGYTQSILSQKHHFYADEPIPLGGKDKGPTPLELLQGALASCTAITLRMYCEHKNLDVDTISVSVKRDKKTIIENDRQVNTNLFSLKLDIQGNVDEKTKKRMKKIAARCPVHQVLRNQQEFNITLI